MNETEITDVLVDPSARAASAQANPLESLSGSGGEQAHGQPPPPDGGDAVYQQCDQCGAPTDHNQRYCVVCGAQLRRATDPAARYLSEATASRQARRASSAPASSSRRSAPRRGGLGIALMLALIPVAAAVGVQVGRSSNNGDAQLIQALARRQGTVTVSSAARPAAPRTAAVAHAKRAKARTSGASPKASPTKSTSSTKGGGKVISTTKNGSAQQISGFKATKSEEQQGAKATQQVQKSTGKNYVNSQNSLPAQVVVP